MDVGCCFGGSGRMTPAHAAPPRHVNARQIGQVLHSGLAHSGWLQSMHRAAWLFAVVLAFLTADEENAYRG